MRHFRRHAPRKRGIQYATAYRFNRNPLGVLDRPVKPGDDTCCVVAASNMRRLAVARTE